VRAAVEEMKNQGAVIVSVPLPELNTAMAGTSVIDFEFSEDSVTISRRVPIRRFIRCRKSWISAYFMLPSKAATEGGWLPKAATRKNIRKPWRSALP